MGWGEKAARRSLMPAAPRRAPSILPYFVKHGVRRQSDPLAEQADGHRGGRDNVRTRAPVVELGRKRTTYRNSRSHAAGTALEDAPGLREDAPSGVLPEVDGSGCPGAVENSWASIWGAWQGVGGSLGTDGEMFRRVAYVGGALGRRSPPACA